MSFLIFLQPRKGLTQKATDTQACTKINSTDVERPLGPTPQLGAQPPPPATATA